jgi:hypothetical protein
MAHRRVDSPPDAHRVSPNKAGSVQLSARAWAERERELDAFLGAISHGEVRDFCDKLFRYAFDRGYECGWREGRTAGRRAAKGIKTPAKKRGRPPEINESERTLLIDDVDNRKPGQTQKEAVTDFLRMMQAGKLYGDNPTLGKDIDDTPALPSHLLDKRIPPATVTKALQAYYRHRPRKRTP